MGYTSKETDPYEPVVQIRFNGNLVETNVGQSSYKEFWARSGTNRNKKNINENRGRKEPLQCMKPVKRFQVVRVNNPVLVWDRKNKRWFRTRNVRIPIPRLQKVKKKRTVIRDSNLVPNDLSFSKVTLLHPGDSTVSVIHNGPNPPWVYRYSGDLLSNFHVSGSTYLSGGVTSFLDSSISSSAGALVNKLSAQGLSQLYEKTKNQDVNAACGLAERKQTCQMIKEIVTRLATAIIKAKSGNILAASRALFPTSAKGIANDHLMYQYGIKPLLSDLNGAVKMLAESSGPKSFDVNVRKRESSDVETILDTVTNYPTMSCRTTVTSMVTVEVAYKARLRLSDEWLSSANRLGFTNLGSVAWELTPYSFIVDWLVPIGDYLNNQDAFVGLQVEWCTKTVCINETIFVKRTFGGTNSAGWVTTPNVQEAMIKKLSVTRTLLPSVPPLPLPSFKDPVSKGHIANALALITQATSKKKR